MAFYVEVMCDVRTEGCLPKGLDHICYSNAGDNPQGVDKTTATREARRHGWVVRGRWACCPGCLRHANKARNNA